MEQKSNFTTPVGLGLLLVMLLAAAYFRAAVLEIFLAGLLLLCIAAFAWARFSLRKLNLRIRGGDICGFPGEVLEAEAELKNQKLLPLIWLEFRLPRTKGCCIAPEWGDPADDPLSAERETEPVTVRFAWILPHQTLHWRQRVRAARRGVYRLDRGEAVSGDGFGLTSRKCTAALGGGARFVVYPRIRPVEVQHLMRTLRELEPAKNGFYADRTLLNTVRDWRDGDSVRDINWRLLARTDNLQVNVHETLDARRLCLLPDLFSFSRMEEIRGDGVIRFERRTDEPSLERMLSLLASLITALTERDVLCTLVVPAYGGSPVRVLIPESRDGQVAVLLTALAEIDYHGEETSLPFDELVAQHHLLGQIFLASRDFSSSMWHDAPELTEELGAMRILQEMTGDCPEDTIIFQETDLFTK